MEALKTSAKLHPLMAGAAASVILVSLLGVAAITGILPGAHGSAAPNAPVATNATATPAINTAVNVNDPAMNSANPAGTSSEAYPVTTTAALPAPQQYYDTAGTQQAASPPPPAATPVATICSNCGTIESVHAIEHQAKPSGLGAVAGAVLGGVIGNHFGGGTGRALTTVGGAVGGGYAGNEIEKRTHTTTSYQVRVRMENGKTRSFSYPSPPGWGVGDHVRVVNGTLATQG